MDRRVERHQVERRRVECPRVERRQVERHQVDRQQVACHQDQEVADLAFANLLAIMHQAEEVLADLRDLREVRAPSCPAMLDLRADPDLVASYQVSVL